MESEEEEYTLPQLKRIRKRIKRNKNQPFSARLIKNKIGYVEDNLIAEDEDEPE